jgi:exodeoxyribonuclease-3
MKRLLFVYKTQKNPLMKKIISYNLNGLRSAISKGFMEWLQIENPDIICLQETKIQEDQINKMAFEFLGYHQVWHSAIKKGYSGVAILSKEKPDSFSIGIGIPDFDSEGRLICTNYGDITLVNSYFPSGTMGEVRQSVKMLYLDALYNYLSKLKESRPNIILTGDYNIAHTFIDINNPKRHLKTSGFLPEEREWMDKLIALGFVDTFRVFNQLPEQYSWWSYRAGSRSKNLGWRLDYCLVSETLKDNLYGAGILKDIMHSDHCPVYVILK